MKEVNRYKLTVIRQKSHEDIMDSMVTTVNNTELCIWQCLWYIRKLPRVDLKSYEKKIL